MTWKKSLFKTGAIEAEKVDRLLPSGSKMIFQPF